MTVSKIIFASALALSAIVPAFAYEGDEDTVLNPNTDISTTRPLAQHVVGIRAHRAMDARAHAPVGAPVGADFSKGSQGY